MSGIDPLDRAPRRGAGGALVAAAAFGCAALVGIGLGALVWAAGVLAWDWL